MNITSGPKPLLDIEQAPVNPNAKTSHNSVPFDSTGWISVKFTNAEASSRAPLSGQNVKLGWGCQL